MFMTGIRKTIKVIHKTFFLQFLKKMPKLVEITNGAIKPLSRQASVQSTKSINSIITPTEVSERQSSAVGITTPTVDGSLSRTPSIKRDSLVSRNSTTGGSGDQEPLMEQSETTELMCES